MHPLEDKIWSNLYYYLYFFLYRSTKSVRTSLSWTSFRQVRTQIALYNPPSYTIYTSVYFKFVPKGQQANWSEFNLHRSFNLSVSEYVCLWATDKIILYLTILKYLICENFDIYMDLLVVI